MDDSKLHDRADTSDSDEASALPLVPGSETAERSDDEAIEEQSHLEQKAGELEAKVSCPQCSQCYSDPRFLPCLHIFCAGCLEQLATASPSSHKDEDATPEQNDPVTEQAKSGALACPVCGKEFQLPPNGTKGFQTALAMAELVKSYQFIKRYNSSPSREVKCDQCDMKAVEYCYMCSKFACDICSGIHKRWRHFIGHRVVSLDDLENDPAKVKALSAACEVWSYCPKHHDEKLKLYCDTCQEFICCDCTVKSHKEHSYEFVTEDTLTAHRERMLDAKTSLSDLCQQLESSQGSLAAQTERIERQIAETKAQIEAALTQRREKLDLHKRTLLERVDEVTRTPLSELQRRGKEIEDLQQQASTCQEFLSQNLEQSSPTCLISVERTVCDRIEEISNDVHQKQPPQREMPRIEFWPAMQVAPLGQVTCCRGRANTDDSSSADSEISSEFFEVHSTTETPEIMYPTPLSFHHSLFMQSIHLGMSSRFESSGLYPGNETSGDLQPTGAETLKFLGIPVRTIEGISRPNGIAVTNRLAVCEFGTHQVSVLELDGKRVTAFGGKGERKGRFLFPNSVATDREGKFLVSDANYRIQLFTPAGKCVKCIGAKGSGELQFKDPTGVAISKSTRAFICDRANNHVMVLDKMLSFSTMIGKKGKQAGEFNCPSDIACDGNGNIYVADGWNHRVQVFTEDGTFIHQFGKKGSAPGQLNTPSHLCVDPDGYIYISEIRNHRVSIFRSNGEFVTFIGSEGNKLGQLKEPRGVAVDQNRVLYVSDFGNNRIHVFK